MVKNNKLKKYILAISLCSLLIICSIFTISLAYFYDQKNGSTTINLAQMKTEAVVVDNLTPSDLIADNIFTKKLDITFTGNFEIYFRVYAVVSVDTYKITNAQTNAKEKEVRTDLVSLTGADRALEGDDNKFYYAYDGTTLGTTPLTITPTSSTPVQTTLNLTFTVSDIVNETLFEKADYSFDNTLKAKITYYVEYVQAEGYDDWKLFKNIEDGSTYTDETQNLTYTYFNDIGASYVSQVGVDYGLNGVSGYVLTEGYNATGDITIPSKINRKPMVMIGELAFVELNENGDPKTDSNGLPTFAAGTELKSVLIEEGITKIGAGAFAFCTELNHINIPEGVTSIETMTFYYAIKLISLELPKSLTKIGANAFYDFGLILNIYYAGTNEQWQTITIENTLSTLTKYNYNWDGSIESIVTDNQNLIYAYSTENNGYAVQYGYNAVGEVTIPSQINNIDVVAVNSYAFSCDVHLGFSSNNTTLTKVILGDNITKISDYAFSHCSNLKTFEFSKNLEIIEDDAFFGSTNFETIYINGLVYDIDFSALATIYVSTEIPEANVGTDITTWGNRDTSKDIAGKYYAYSKKS